MQLSTWKFDTAVDGISGEQELKVEKWTTYSEADLRQTLAYLSELLKD